MLLSDLIKDNALNEFRVKNFLQEKYPMKFWRITDLDIDLDPQIIKTVSNEFNISLSSAEPDVYFKDHTHQNFEFLENRGNYSLVAHADYPDQRFTTVPLELEAGDSIILFTNGIMQNGNPKLDYSALNDYMPGKSYAFHLVGKTFNNNGLLVRGDNILQHFLPLSFEDQFQDGIIYLEVKDIDKEKNRLIFKNDDAQEEQKPLTVGETYLFTILRQTTNQHGTHFLEIEHDGSQYRSLAQKIQVKHGHPDQIYMTVIGKDEYGYKFNQNLYLTLSEKYTPNTEADFTIIDISTDKNGFSFFILKDEYQLYHRFYDLSALDSDGHKIGDSLRLLVSGVNEKGFLELKAKSQEWDKVFFSPDEFFTAQDIHRDKYFYPLADLSGEFGEGDAEQEDQPFQPYQQMMDQIASENNNWIFSYLNLLNFKVSALVNEGLFFDAQDFIQVYIKTESWLVNSEILSTYSPAKRQQVYDSALNQIKKSETLSQRLDEISTGQHYQLITQIHEKVERLGIISSEDVERIIDYLSIQKDLLNDRFEEIRPILSNIIEHRKLSMTSASVLDQVLEIEVPHVQTDTLQQVITGYAENPDAEIDTATAEILYLQYKLHVFMEKETANYKLVDLIRYLAPKETDEGIRKMALEKAFSIITGDTALKFGSIENFIRDLARIPIGENEVSLYSQLTGDILYMKKGCVLKAGNHYILTSKNEPKDNEKFIRELCIVRKYFGDKLLISALPSDEAHYRGLEDNPQVFWFKYFYNSSYQYYPDSAWDAAGSSTYRKLLSIINLIDLMLVYEKDFDQKLDLLNLAKLLSSIIKNAKSFFYGEIIHFFELVKRLNDPSRIPNTRYVNEETMRNFPQLEILAQGYKLLALLKSEAPEEELGELLSQMSEEMQDMNRLIPAFRYVHTEKKDPVLEADLLKLFQQKLADHILKLENYTAEVITREVKEEDSQEGSDEEDAYIGKESETVEFKTSAVYHPEHKEPAPELQLMNLLRNMAGFMNRKGGEIYIGVNDKGRVTGLEPDFEAMRLNEDSFERFIRAGISKYFGNFINQKIAIEFLNRSDKLIAKIQVPASDELVPLQDEFYQRQGTDTRMLKGRDLIQVIQEKTVAANS